MERFKRQLSTVSNSIFLIKMLALKISSFLVLNVPEEPVKIKTQKRI